MKSQSNLNNSETFGYGYETRNNDVLETCNRTGRGDEPVATDSTGTRVAT